MTYQVNEIFTSLQGEGLLTGFLATFIRLQGCTVGCPWCDSGPLADATWGRQTNGTTRNTWGKGGERMTVDEILSQVQSSHVVITGGEPTLHNLDDLISGLRDDLGVRLIQLETSGQQWLKGRQMPDWITWSPKQSLNWIAPEPYYVFADEIKWVVDEALSWDTVIHGLQSCVAIRGHRVDGLPAVVLMPEGCPPRPEMIQKTRTWLRQVPKQWSKLFRYGDRLQYRLGIR